MDKKPNEKLVVVLKTFWDTKIQGFVRWRTSMRNTKNKTFLAVYRHEEIISFSRHG